MPSAMLGEDGQVVVPAEVRERLGLRPGMRVRFVPLERGRILFQARSRRVSSLRGVLPYDGPPRSLDDLDAAVLEHLAKGERSP